ncbi:EpsD family peptidyl-prolyl cis-trans isomerase [Piscinibacter sp.]|uniref:EpsD family peptidyl-prolyl cis-trans isomerase n=1 Tax=Piscinibacter sp. TaxID=1903157 RepID=UPI002B547BCF|nr:EpsD family peptidyl-prolyl cis-trans isomerase [Albitalea sp.]HUG22121.1 EpsD family peptidyl-prolyl cis-trans isomerase [Albitalea sp.]
MNSTQLLSRPLPAAGRAAVIAVTALTVLLAGCGDKKKDKPATQTAARVNEEEITVHQINYMLQQQRALPPEQAASAGKLVLERLIDQELALQKAMEQKVDRDPRITQQLEAARREIIARAYVDKIGAGTPKPAADEISAYYAENPALFKERRVYTLQEIAIEATPEQVAELRTKLQAAKNVNEFVDHLRAGQFKFTGNQAVRAAEQLPLASLKTFAQLKDGQAIFNQMPKGAQVIILVGSRSQPVDETRARPAIEQFLLNERKRKVIADDLKALRKAAEVEYLGAYARQPGDPDPEEEALEVKPTVSPMTSTPASDIEPIIPITPASVPSGTALDKGLKGLK